MSQAFEYILDYTDFFLPSDGELDYFGLSKSRDEEENCRQGFTSVELPMSSLNVAPVEPVTIQKTNNIMWLGIR